MSGLRFSGALAGLLSLLAITSTHAQQTSFSQIVPWIPTWSCGSVWPSIGLYVDSVSEDGRYLTLEDSTIWEVQPTDRSGAAGWKRDNFVQVHRVAGPNSDYGLLFTNVSQQDWHAAVRLAGRVRPRVKSGE
jgi:hypothetical protein